MLAYVFLVALPILGLVAILKSGRTLKAPFWVDGSWTIESQKIESGADHPSASPCGDFFSSVSNTPFLISQSGKTLVVILTGAKTATGTLDGKTINAQFTGSEVAKDQSGAPACGDRNLTLTATLDPVAEPRTLSGTFSVDGCATCAPMEFRAVRQPRPAGSTR